MGTKTNVTLEQIKAARGSSDSKGLGILSRITKYYETTCEEVRTTRAYCRTDAFKDKVASRTLDILNK